MKTRLMICMLVSALSVSCKAQSILDEAQKAYAAQKWVEAFRAYQDYLNSNEADSLAWYRLAVSHLNLNQYDKALGAFNRALALNYPKTFIYYGISRVYAMQSDSDKMNQALDSLIINGFGNFKLLENDTAFQAYRTSPKFESTLVAARENAYPCLTDSVRRHFDFWIGEWEVYVRGRKVGENSISVANGGCVIHEKYTTSGTYSGQSMNYYDPLDKKWHQLWVGSSGGVLDYVEIDRNPGMIRFQCDYLNAEGMVVKSRLTFTANPDGTVRQFFENSNDGEAWTPGFDGLYKPKKADD